MGIVNGMITLRLDVGNPSGFSAVRKVLDEVVGQLGKHWYFDICNATAYGDAISEEEYYILWNTMYLVDIKIRSHKKATMFALKWNK